MSSLFKIQQITFANKVRSERVGRGFTSFQPSIFTGLYHGN